LLVPLRKDGALLGAIRLFRQEVRPFSNKQIALLQNFAAQAVIAMENARLINETREALEQQTATTEVLSVINSSPGDLTPVFQAMLERATRLCDAPCAMLWTHDGEAFSVPATLGVPEAFAEYLRKPLEIQPSVFLGALKDGEIFVHNRDLADTDSYRSGNPLNRAVVDLGGARTGLLVPLQKDGRFLGAFRIYRHEVRPFTDKQIALLQNFAAQAVIAMENARLLTETRESLEQQTATAEVLGVINSSPGDLAPVFDAMLERAMRLCGAAFGTLRTYDGSRFHIAAAHGVPPAFAEFLARNPYEAQPGTIGFRILESKAAVHVADAKADEVYRVGDAQRRALVDLGGARTSLVVPLMNDAVVLGTIQIYRQHVQPFSDKQVALLENFAAQAVIAMENARLITETREALEQQTATAEVLQVINSSPGDLAPVFDAMLEKALRLCDAAFGHLLTFDGERFDTVAGYGEPHVVEHLRQRGPFRPPLDRLNLLRRIVVGGEHFLQVADVLETDEYRTAPGFREMVDLGGYRTLLNVALRKDNALFGVIVIFRKETRPFTDKQISLLQNFAAQAVIAMENARLLTETREALEQQTATAEVLGVINSSPGDLAPVFEAILEKAHSLCGIAFGSLQLHEDGKFRAIAVRGVPGPLADMLRLPHEPRPGAPPFRLLAGERIVHIADMADPSQQVFPRSRAAVEHGFRTALYVPLRRRADLFGFITAYRDEVRSFSEKEIALLENFAAQAVIAMENARLLTETREALDQQTATAEVLQVINSSPGDLAPVFDTMLDKAIRLCDGAQGTLWMFDGDRQYAAAVAGMSAEVARQLGEPREIHPYQRRLREGERIFQIPDLSATEAYRSGNPLIRLAVEATGVRTAAFVALVKDATTLGNFTITRKEIRPFSDKQTALLQNFAAQAVTQWKMRG
jgi:GAF domain-containing protein